MENTEKAFPDSAAKRNQRNGLTGPKRGEIPHLLPFQEAVLTSVCLYTGRRRPERLTVLPKVCCQCGPTHGYPPPQTEKQPRRRRETGAATSHQAA